MGFELRGIHFHHLVNSYVENIPVALQHGVERVQVSLSVSSGLSQCLDLARQAPLLLSRFRSQSLQRGLQIATQMIDLDQNSCTAETVYLVVRKSIAKLLIIQ